MKRTMIPMPERQPGQIINPDRQKKKHIMRTMGLKTGKAYHRYLKDQRRKTKAGIDKK
jgi:hypothetical protein